MTVWGWDAAPRCDNCYFMSSLIPLVADWAQSLSNRAIVGGLELDSLPSLLEVGVAHAVRLLCTTERLSLRAKAQIICKMQSHPTCQKRKCNGCVAERVTACEYLLCFPFPKPVSHPALPAATPRITHPK